VFHAMYLMKSDKAEEHFPKVYPASCSFHTSSIEVKLLNNMSRIQ
jgi:hypothetical protein